MPIQKHHGLAGRGLADSAVQGLGGALENSTGVSLTQPRGLLGGIVDRLKRTFTRASAPSVTVASAGAGPDRDLRVRLRTAKTPALAIDRLATHFRGRVGGADPAARAAAGQAGAPAAAAAPAPAAAPAAQALPPGARQHGPAQRPVAVIEERLPQQTRQYLSGLNAFAGGVFGASTAAVKAQTALARQELLTQITTEYGQLQALKSLPEPPLSASRATRAEASLAAAVIRMLVPEFRAQAYGDEAPNALPDDLTRQARLLGPNLGALSARGVLTPELLATLEQRADFYARQTADPQDEAAFALAKLNHLTEYLVGLGAAGNFGEAYLAKEFQTAHALYQGALAARDQGNHAPLEDLRLRAFESLVDDLYTFSDRHSDAALALKLTAASTEAEKEIVTLRHELNQAKRHLLRLAQDADGGQGVDSSSFRNLALDAVLLELWRQEGVSQDLNLLIGHALALQTTTMQRHDALHQGAAHGSSVVIGLEDLRKIGLSDKSLDRLKRAPAMAEDILQNARRFAEMGLTNTRELRQMRSLTASALKNVLDSRLVKMANKDIRGLAPEARLEVLGALLTQSRGPDVGSRLGGDAVRQRLAQVTMPGVPAGRPEEESQPALRHQAAGRQLAAEVDRLVALAARQEDVQARVADLAKNGGLKVDSQDKKNLSVAQHLQGYQQAAELKQQMVGLRTRLEEQLADLQPQAPRDAGVAQALAQVREDIASAQKVIRDADLAMTQAESALRRDSGPLADRLWKNPLTSRLNVGGKLAQDPTLASLAYSLTQLADIRLQMKNSEEAIKTLDQDQQKALAVRRSALGADAQLALTIELRQVVAGAYLEMLREQAAAGKAPGKDAPAFIPATAQDVIRERLAARGVPLDLYEPEITDLLHRELTLKDMEQWVREAKDSAGIARRQAPPAAPDEAPLSASAQHVVSTIAHLRPGERYFLNRGTDVTANTGGISTVLTGGFAKISLSVGGGSAHAFEVSHLGDQVLLTVQDSDQLDLKLGVKGNLPAGVGSARAAVGVNEKVGQGFVARFDSAETLAREVEKLYQKRALDLQSLSASATEVSFLSSSELRVMAQARADLELGGVITGMAGAEAAKSPYLGMMAGMGPGEDAGSLPGRLLHPFGLGAGAQVVAGAAHAWMDGEKSNNASVTYKSARSYDLYAEASAGISLSTPTLAATLANELDLKDQGLIGKQFAGKAGSEQEEGGGELYGAKVRVASEKVVSELSITQSRRDDSLQAATRSFKFAAPAGMTLERLARTAPGYARQIEEAAGSTREQVDALFGKITGKGHDLVLTAQLKPALMEAWNRDHEAARQALEFDRPRLTAARYEAEAIAIATHFGRRLEDLTSDDANMQVSGLSLTRTESSDRGLALNAVLLRMAFTAGAGLGTLVDKVSFATPRGMGAAAAGPRALSDDTVRRMMAETDSRREMLLSRFP